MRRVLIFTVSIISLLAASPAVSSSCSGLIKYIEAGSLYGMRMKGIDKGHTLTVTKVDKENCVLAATTGKGDIILIDVNSISVLTKQK